MAEGAKIDLEGDKGAQRGNENVENDPICEHNYIDRAASITREQFVEDLDKRNDIHALERKGLGVGQGRATEDKHYLWGVSSILGFGLLVDRYQTHLANFTLENSASSQSGEEQGKELALNTWLVTTRQGREHEVGFWIDTSINPLASYRFEDYFSIQHQEIVRLHLIGRFQARHFGEDLFTTSLNFTTKQSVWQKVSGFDGYIFTTNFEVISEEGNKRQRYTK
jgi:hypothetical protein